MSNIFDIFLSYRRSDAQALALLFRYLLTQKRYSVFLDTEEMEYGSFPQQIVTSVSECKDFILFVSKSTFSERIWDENDFVRKEIRLALELNKNIIPICFDLVKMPDLNSLPPDIAKISNYHAELIMNLGLIEDHLEKMQKQLHSSPMPYITSGDRMQFSELGIQILANSDSHFSEDDETLKVFTTGERFLLSPSKSEEIRHRLQDLGIAFTLNDDIFSGCEIEYFSEIMKIPDLHIRIEKHRALVTSNFLNGENGCYFNNRKFGIYRLNTFQRTQDVAENAKLTIELFETDYYTHRVIKGVYKELYKEAHPYCQAAFNPNDMKRHMLFSTSLGVNLILIGENITGQKSALLTTRSTFAAESNGEEQYSLSVIEGVSHSDLNEVTKKVSLELAALRGLHEELGVKEQDIVRRAIKFHDLFLNQQNYEIGIVCSAAINSIKCNLERDVLQMIGQDDKLEVSTKRLVVLDQLKQFALTNKSKFLPQALFSVGTFLCTDGDRSMFKTW